MSNCPFINFYLIHINTVMPINNPITYVFLLFSVKPEHYLNTMDFLDAINQEFQKQWKA